MTKRINLTQHNATPEQACAPRSKEQAKQIKRLLTFEEPPNLEEIYSRAQALAEIASEVNASEAMIGGAPYLVLALDPALRMRGIEPLYAFSRRESVEVQQEDGSVVKRTVFRHLGFVRLQSCANGHTWEVLGSSLGVTYLRCKVCGEETECY